MSIMIDKLMTQIRDYSERETVEWDLESVLRKVGEQDLELLNDIYNLLIEEPEIEDPFVETNLNWESLKEGDEVLLTECYVNREKAPIRMVVMLVEEDMVALRECDQWDAAPWMSKEIFEKRIITHWTKK